MNRFVSILFCLLMVAMSVCADELNDSIVSDDELERWLEKYGVSLDTVKASAAEEIPVVVEEKKLYEEQKHVEKQKQADVQELRNSMSVKREVLDALKMSAVNVESGAPTLSDNQHVDILELLEKQTSVEVLKPAERPTRIPNLESLKYYGTSSEFDSQSADDEYIVASDEDVAARDSFALYRETQVLAASNPIFLDWVLGATDAVSTSLTGDDSIVVALRHGAKEYVRRTQPELYDYHVSQLPKAADIKGRRMKSASPDNIAIHSDYLSRIYSESLSKATPDLPKWALNAKFELHVTQGYISPNWYQGGESNLSGKVYVMGTANYNDNDKIQWDNKIEWKLTINSAGSDTLRMLRVDEDLIHLNTKFGYKAFDNFYYTGEADLQSSFFNTYKPSTYIRTSGLLSPVRMNLSLGIDYKYKKLSVLLSPVSFKMICVMDTTYHPSVLPSENIAHQVGITDGSKSLVQLGALLRVGWQHKFNDSIGMEVKFSFFGNYVGKRKGVETDLEVIGDFRINRFLSAKLTLNPRFDSTVETPDGKKPKLQFKEIVSFGFQYVI